MSNFITEMAEAIIDDKAHSGEFGEVELLLDEGSDAIPGCAIRPDGTFIYSKAIPMIYVRMKRDDPAITVEGVKRMVKPENIGQAMKEVLYFYSSKNREEIEKLFNPPEPDDQEPEEPAEGKNDKQPESK